MFRAPALRSYSGHLDGGGGPAIRPAPRLAMVGARSLLPPQPSTYVLYCRRTSARPLRSVGEFCFFSRRSTVFGRFDDGFFERAAVQRAFQFRFDSGFLVVREFGNRLFATSRGSATGNLVVLVFNRCAFCQARMHNSLISARTRRRREKTGSTRTTAARSLNIKAQVCYGKCLKSSY